MLTCDVTIYMLKKKKKKKGFGNADPNLAFHLCFIAKAQLNLVSHCPTSVWYQSKDFTSCLHDQGDLLGED